MKSKNEKGITLIALIITIIVMLILVAVTVNVAINGGLFKEADDASKGTEEEAIYDQIVSAMVLKDKGILNVPATANAAIADLKAKGYAVSPEEVSDEISEVTLTVTGKKGAYKYTITGEEIFSEENGIGGNNPGGGNNTPEEEPAEITDDLSPTTSYIGYYANLDNDPTTAEGIIYVDLMKGANNGQTEVSGIWNSNANSTYSYKTVEESKAYSVSTTNYTGGKFGSHPIISVKEGSTGNDRFYVMALSDIEGDTYNWNKECSTNLYNIGDDYIEENSTDQVAMQDATGKAIGKRNTEILMAEPNLTGNTNNLWNKISTQVDSGWFVPSRAEWSAFNDFMYSKIEGTKCNSGNFSDTFGLSMSYWTSSQMDTSAAWFTNVFLGYTFGAGSASDCCVRLSTTF